MNNLWGDSMKVRVRDRVVILDTDGNRVAKGTVVNINEYREPSMMYAIDVDGYSEDVLFFGESQLLKIEKCCRCKKEYEMKYMYNGLCEWCKEYYEGRGDLYV